jgi:hypothetical protein
MHAARKRSADLQERNGKTGRACVLAAGVGCVVVFHLVSCLYICITSATFDAGLPANGRVMHDMPGKAVICSEEHASSTQGIKVMNMYT